MLWSANGETLTSLPSASSRFRIGDYLFEQRVDVRPAALLHQGMGEVGIDVVVVGRDLERPVKDPDGFVMPRHSL